MILNIEWLYIEKRSYRVVCQFKHRKPRATTEPTPPPPVAPEVVIMTTYGVNSNDKQAPWQPLAFSGYLYLHTDEIYEHSCKYAPTRKLSDNFVWGYRSISTRWVNYSKIRISHIIVEGRHAENHAILCTVAQNLINGLRMYFSSHAGIYG